MQKPIQVSDINVVSTVTLPTPTELRNEVRKSESQAQFVWNSRQEIHRIIFGDDNRLLVVAGPCSIHDVKAGLEYAENLKELSEKLSDRLCIVMRAYFEKPRTSVGWKGLIMDPYLDKSCDITHGLRLARAFLKDLIDLGLPTATEMLDPITPQYIADLVSWSAVGARTTESQTHRQMASGLSMPLGFKNSTDGSVQAAINAIKAASITQTFLGINQIGNASAVTTKGNPNCHLVIRGGSSGPNYHPHQITEFEELLQENGLIQAIMVDCSHANSGKNHDRQTKVLDSVVEQVQGGRKSIIGVMLESNLGPGRQEISQGKSDLQFGVSVTDSCIDWDTTEKALHSLHSGIQSRFD
ncbi:MAG: 3-deoxy-7-phosphoheptulonate synthase [Opitutae bacterium]|nr:3-deoxy-7-phosphoheptulonate synthase [Opitutae bacterium]